jgi:hypothetical protein
MTGSILMPRTAGVGAVLGTWFVRALDRGARDYLRHDGSLHGDRNRQGAKLRVPREVD